MGQDGILPHLEPHAQRKLDQPRIARRGVLSELGVYLRAGRVKARRRIESAELRVVEGIVQLASELQSPTFGNQEILGQ